MKSLTPAVPFVFPLHHASVFVSLKFVLSMGTAQTVSLSTTNLLAIWL